MPSPTEEDQEDLLLSCRFGDLHDIQHFIATFSPDVLNAIIDDNGNSVLHMAAANGHARESPTPFPSTLARPSPQTYSRISFHWYPRPS